MRPIDVLVVGAGPAGLATAIRVRQRLAGAAREPCVVVIDKAPRSGAHNLSGALFEAACLDELLPGWSDQRSEFRDHVVPIEQDDLYYLRPKRAFHVPSRLVPGPMRHIGNVAISVSRLADFLARRAEGLGVEVHAGFSATTLLVEDGAVRGVRLSELGLAADGTPKDNYQPAEEVRAAITVLADGSRGVLSTQLAEHFGRGPNPQVYGLGIKAVVGLPRDNPLGPHRAVHTVGYPHPSDVFGGGFVYSLGDTSAAVGLILGLDWRYGNLDPLVEFEAFRAHPFIRELLAGSVTLATGAKTIAEGGYYALGPVHVPGALVVGDAAGFVNVEKLKGLHYAVRSGICAGDAIADAFAADDLGGSALARYPALLAERGILGDLHRARNFRQGFRWDLAVGAGLSKVGGRIPVRLGMDEDRRATRPGSRLAREGAHPVDGATFVSLSGTTHREDEPSHVLLVDPARCAACGADHDHACTHFCPADVYRWSDDRLVVSASNCLHCMSCSVKCPQSNILWHPPEGGEGPRYKLM